eukprot:TRINITY_DN47973_c0_g1_i2.p3 TRINITY_DN47973_c0_g1~~TRINITY_DN47973_c0_g1_i2.p3  ORF type:complete len:150 (-),score=17.65 TRINITY_DN47973_c0_g1_i2:231-680(-)
MYLRPEFHAHVPGKAKMKASRGEVGKVLKGAAGAAAGAAVAGDTLLQSVASIQSMPSLNSLGNSLRLGRADADAVNSSGALGPDAPVVGFLAATNTSGSIANHTHPEALTAKTVCIDTLKIDLTGVAVDLIDVPEPQVKGQGRETLATL